MNEKIEYIDLYSKLEQKKRTVSYLCIFNTINNIWQKEKNPLRA